MNAIVLPNYNKNVLRAMLGLKLEEITMPVLNDDELLIKTSAAACNPSDIAFIQGVYNIVKPLPAIPGFEGTGEIVDCGNNFPDLLGKNVSAFVQSDSSGTWAEYFVAEKSDIIILEDGMPIEQAACFTVNPFTTFAMFQWAEKTQTKSILQNAAGSQVAGFLRAMAAEKGIKVIDIVRKQETAIILQNEGAKHVLVESDEDFDEKLISICNQLKPQLAFDAVGGSLSGKMFNALSKDSRLIVYGGLSNKPMSEFNLMGTIFHNKIISGFNLIDWKLQLKEGEFDKISSVLQKKFIDGVYKTKINKSVKFDDVVKGIKTYLGNMSSGKLILKP